MPAAVNTVTLLRQSDRRPLERLSKNGLFFKNFDLRDAEG
jgi:hypothetical protein